MGFNYVAHKCLNKNIVMKNFRYLREKLLDYDIAIAIVVTFCGIIIWDSYSSPPVEDQSPCRVGEEVSGKFFIIEDNVPFRTGPGLKYEKVVNQKMAALGVKDYRELSPAYALEGMYETEDWFQGRIVEVDGLERFWGEGWVKKDSLEILPQEIILLG